MRDTSFGDIDGSPVFKPWFLGAMGGTSPKGTFIIQFEGIPWWITIGGTTIGGGHPAGP
jgi:hypothetical protein